MTIAKFILLLLIIEIEVKELYFCNNDGVVKCCKKIHHICH